MNKITKTIIVALIIICLFLLARFVVFKKNFDQFSKDMDNLGEWQDNYKKDHPNATKAEIDAAFNAQWK